MSRTLSVSTASTGFGFTTLNELDGVRPAWRSSEHAPRVSNAAPRPRGFARRLHAERTATVSATAELRKTDALKIPAAIPRDASSMTEVARGARVVIAEDDMLMREGLASLLDRNGYDLVGQAGDAAELMRLVGEHRPELAIIDVRMPPSHRTEGLDAARAIREEFPDTAILILSAHVEVAHAMTLLASGRGSGYILKSRVAALDEFLDAVERVRRGGSVIDPALVHELVTAPNVADPLEELTPREREVLSLMAEGRSNTGISRRLWITEGTVEKHVHSIMMKLRLPETDDDHRRVLAAITFLDAHQDG